MAKINEVKIWDGEEFSLLNTVNKAGDTMTGSLNIERSGNAGKLRTIDPAIILGTNPSEQITSGGVAMIDGNGVTYANMYTYQETNGRTNLVFSLSNKSSSTANLNSSNNLMLRQMPDGTNSVYVRDAAAWRSALGIYPINVQQAYMPAAGTRTFTLNSSGLYMVFVGKLNNATATTSGVYFVSAHSSNSHVRAIVSASDATVSISGVTLTVTTTNTYYNISVIQVGQG